MTPEPRASSAESGLLAAACAGDERAVEKILRTHAQLVMALGLRLLGNKADAEDLLQDVFIRIHRGLSGFRGEASLKTWVCQVTINAARNRIRDQRRREMTVVPSLDRPVDAAEPDGRSAADNVPDPSASPERRAQSMETHARIEAALADLSEEYREAVVLREIEGMSYEEIATTLEVNVGTVKSRIARGRARLQEALADLLQQRRSPAP